jgi:RNA polymerase sigma-70 factor (ECF subfamily)
MTASPWFAPAGAEVATDDEPVLKWTHPGRKLRPFHVEFVYRVRRHHMQTHHPAPATTRDLNDSWADTLDRLRAFVATRIDDRELAADITQDVIVRSIASGALDSVDNPAAWLYRSARNAVIDHYRTRRAHDPLVDSDAWPDPESTDGLPNEATRELSRCLQPLLDQMPTAAREALVRVDVDGQTQQRAAHDLGLSVSGMKSRVQRARRDLRQLLEQCCAVDLDTHGAIADYHPNADTCGCAAAPDACS